MNQSKVDIIKYNEYTVIGNSVAAFGTCIYIKELKLAFDMGILVDGWVHNTDVVCISHGHCDHIGQLHIHAIRKKFMDGANIPTYIMPKYCIEHFNTMYKAVSGMNCGSYTELTKNYDGLDYKLVTTESTNSGFEFRKNFFIKPVKLDHKILDFGYIVSEKRTKLKEEYLSLTGKEIAKLRKEGKDIFYHTETPIFGFSGDSCIDAIVNNEQLMNSKVLIMECTYVDDSISPQDATKFGHVHLYQIKENEHKFKNEMIILIHFSQMCTKEQVYQNVEKYLSEEFMKKIVIFANGLN